MRNARTIARAKRGRAEQTSAEARLWSVLRDRRYQGFKIRRQHAIGPWVVDFACVALLLVIEVDGASHRQPEQIAFDAHRTAQLESWGWRVARIANHEVYASKDSLILRLDGIFRDAQAARSAG